MDVFDLTRRLISIPSVSGSEHSVAAFLADYLEAAGFIVNLQQPDKGGPNVYARSGEPDIVLSTHTDTVPPHIEFSEDDEFVYGRGACDAKGIIASMIKAAESLISEGIRDVGLLFVSGEEAGSPGAKAANHIVNQSRFLLNGEPTESKLAVGSKGALRAVLKTTGRAAHSAYPELGESAIEKLLDVLAGLRQLELPTDAVLGPTTMNIGTINGGVAANVIPASAQAELMFRVVTSSEDLQRMIESQIGSRGSVEFPFACDPVFTERLNGFETAVVSFTTDIPLLSNWGRPVLFGPGSILDAHTPHERISKRELADAVTMYARLVHELKTKIRSN